MTLLWPSRPASATLMLARDIDNPSLMNLKVSHHISQCSKHVHKHDKFRITPIYKIKKDDTNLRKEKETHLTNLLKPDLNQ